MLRYCAIISQGKWISTIGEESLFLQNLALNWALAGLNVAYISFELSEGLAAMRMDAMITNIPTRQVMKSMSTNAIKKSNR